MSEIIAGQKYRSAHRDVVMTVVKPSNGKYGVHVDPSDDPGHVGAYELGVFEKMVAEGDMILIAAAVTPAVTPAGARLLRRFVTDARTADLNGGALIFSGRHEVPAARKLKRDGLVECVRESNACRLTEAGRAWLVANSAAYRMANPEVVTVTPIDAAPDETIALLNDVAAEQDRLNLETAQHMVDSMLTARGRTPESIAYVARHALRLMLAANPGDEITTLALAELDRRHPAACVTVEGEFGTGLRWHLVDRDGNPVEAGEYTARDGDRFTIAQHPEVYFGTGTDPRTVAIQWQTIGGKPRRKTQSGNDSHFVEILVDGWNWAAERV